MREPREDPSSIYTVIVRDKAFNLSHSQVERDSPNFFTSSFFDASGQRLTQAIEVSRDPSIFELVLRYLNGYQAVPIPYGLVPPYSTPGTALADLRADAEFYQLDRLRNQCLSQTAENKRTSARYAVITGYFHTLPEDFAPSEEFSQFMPRFSMKLLSKKQYKVSSSGMLSLSVATPFQLSRFSVVANWSERIARAVIQRDANSVDRWELLGWKRDIPNPGLRHSIIFLQLWARPHGTMSS